MHWLDQVLAVPTIGIQTGPLYRTTSEVFASLRPLFDAWSARGLELTFEQAHPMAAKVIRQDGFSIDVLPDNILVAFAYRAKVQDRPGAVPDLEYSTKATPFSVLLDEARSLTTAALEHLAGNIPRPLKRIGFVADCRMTSDTAPPGLSALLEHLGKPWGRPLRIATATLTTDLVTSPEATVRCHHTIDFNEIDRDGDIRVRLDWQHYPKANVVIRKGDQNILQARCREALDYFNDFGAGALDYDS